MESAKVEEVEFAIRLSIIDPVGSWSTSTVQQRCSMKPPKGSGRFPADAFPDEPSRDRWLGRKLAPDWQEFEAALRDATRSLKTLKERYVEIRRAQDQQQELRRRLQQTDLPLAEAQAIKQRLEELEISLESHLLSWRHFQQPFWQAIRFGGLGVIIGWILRGCA